MFKTPIVCILAFNMWNAILQDLMVIIATNVQQFWKQWFDRVNRGHAMWSLMWWIRYWYLYFLHIAFMLVPSKKDNVSRVFRHSQRDSLVRASVLPGQMRNLKFYFKFWHLHCAIFIKLGRYHDCVNYNMHVYKSWVWS